MTRKHQHSTLLNPYGSIKILFAEEVRNGSHEYRSIKDDITRHRTDLVKHGDWQLPNYRFQCLMNIWEGPPV